MFNPAVPVTPSILQVSRSTCLGSFCLGSSRLGEPAIACLGRKNNTTFLGGLIACLVLVLMLAESARAQPGTTPTGRPAELTLESIYHPKHQVDYGGTLPDWHWIEGETSELLIQRDETWKRFDLETRTESTWPVVQQLRNQLAGLEGIETGQAESAAIRAVKHLTAADDPVLVGIGKSLAIVSTDGPARWLTRDATAWRDATLDPTFRRVAYTREGDLYLLEVVGGRQLQLTNDGSDTVLDGLLDWTYQEEIFGRGNFRGFWFSPDGNWLAMLRIDIGGIEAYTLPSASSARGKGIVSRYPKAGDPIPHASLLLWDLRNIDAGELPPPRLVAESTASQERIVTGVWWNPQLGSLVFCISDREQTWRELRTLQRQTLLDGEVESKLLLREDSPAWVEPPTAPGWLDDGSLIWQSELPTGRTRLYHLSELGQRVVPLTPHQFDVRGFSVRPQGDFILLTGDQQSGTVQQQVYRVALPATRTDNGSQPAGTPTSPSLVPLTQQVGWHTPTLSPDGQWFADVFSSATSPPTLAVQSASFQSVSGQPVSDAERIDVARAERTAAVGIIDPKFFDIPTPDGLSLPAMLVRPQASSKQRIPVVIEVYGGPRAPRVVNRWTGKRGLYQQFLAQQGIAILTVDNRSSAGRGLADTWTIQGRVGEVEFQDLMSTVDWLKNQDWVDPARIAIRGWSFGGFLTLYAMTHSQAFKAGIAGGPVADWREYDAFYTERYMGLPEKNQRGYQSTAPVLVADQLHGALLLIHGEADDNVHPSGTLRMAKALQMAGKDFQMMIYPDQAHAIREPNQLWHLSQMVDRFLREQLQPSRSPK